MVHILPLLESCRVEMAHDIYSITRIYHKNDSALTESQPECTVSLRHFSIKGLQVSDTKSFELTSEREQVTLWEVTLSFSVSHQHQLSKLQRKHHEWNQPLCYFQTDHTVSILNNQFILYQGRYTARLT